MTTSKSETVLALALVTTDSAAVVQTLTRMLAAGSWHDDGTFVIADPEYLGALAVFQETLE